MGIEMGIKFCYQTLITVLDNKSKKTSKSSKQMFNQSMEKAL